MIRSWSTAVAFCGLLAIVDAGSWGCTKQQGVEVATIGVDTLVCVLNHEADPPTQIAIECDVADVQQVLTILEAHRAAEVRERAAAAGWDGGGLP